MLPKGGLRTRDHSSSKDAQTEPPSFTYIFHESVTGWAAPPAICGLCLHPMILISALENEINGTEKKSTEEFGVLEPNN
jgi:hypothetical protein